jgi:hypothetical protein
MNLAEGREPFTVVTPKEEMDGLLGVYAEELCDDLDGDDLRVGELRRASESFGELRRASGRVRGSLCTVL